MKSLNGYDYLVVVVYMALMVGIGVYFLRYIKGGSDYFKAGNKLTWWVAGLSSFMSAFSVWMFTGGAGIVYREGLTGGIVLGMTGVATLVGYFLFATLWRRSRVTTLMEYLEERFNLPTHQIASWSYIPVYILYSSTALFSLAIFVSAALNLDIVLVIWISGIVILAYTLLGGVWAVSVTDTVQFLVLLPVCLLLVPLSLMAVGGVEGLVRDVPAGYFSFPSQGLPWHYLVAYLLLVIHGQNTNPIAQRYFSVRNEAEARKVALLCSALFVVGIVIWAVPPMAARVLYPELEGVLNLPNPDEGAFVVIALHLLPHGLIGLLIAAMFAAAMSALDSVYNAMAAIISKDICQRVFSRNLSDKALLRVGQASTLAIGLVVIGLSLLMVRYGVGVFRVMMKISSLTITPLATPMLLGFLYRRAPGWAGLFSFTCSVLVSAVFAFYTPLVDYLKAQGPWVDFSVSTLTLISVGVVSFLVAPYLFSSNDQERKRIEGFFTKLATPVDESKEIQASEIDRTSMAHFIGIISMLMGAMIVLFVFIPGTLNEKLINLGLGAVIFGGGLWLYLAGKKSCAHRIHRD
jgi:solute:Na+ symporter, SSS family